jgi:gliding motility-associated-like protein
MMHFGWMKKMWMQAGILVLLACVNAFSIMAQPFTNKGREFWVGYGHHQYMEPSCNGANAAPNNMNMVLYLSAEQAATVTVTMDSSGIVPGLWWRRTYTIPANTVISTENLPKGTVDAGPSASNPNYDARLFTDPPPFGTGGEGVFRRKGIHIESDVPIVAYAHIYGGVSSGATMLMPTHTWGYAYTSVNSEQRDADRSYSWMYVVAKDNNTLIEITPSATSRLNKPAGVPFQVLLQKGQIYQLIGQSECSTGNGPELTGTRVKSLQGPDGLCHPVAVFGGSSRTGGETLVCGTGSGRDNDMQQLFPEQAWGKRYLTSPFSRSNGTTNQTSVYKVVVKDPTTVVRRNGVPLTGLINNLYYKFASNTPDVIISDKPVLLAQFMSGTSTCNGGDGDPEMVVLSPIEQAARRVGFYRNTRQAINSNFVNIIVPNGGLPSLRIDNSTSFTRTYPHTQPGYTVVVKSWPSAQTQCLVVCDSGFNAVTYGLGGAESYAYNAGTNINNLNGVSDIHNVYDSTSESNLFTCVNTPMELSALIAYVPIKLQWRLSTLAGIVTPAADVTQNNPIPTDTLTINGFVFYKFTLPGTYLFNTSGTHYIPLIATSPTVDVCTREEEFSLEVVVKPSPAVDFTYTQGGCRQDTVTFTPSAPGAGFINKYWRWDYGDGGRDSIQIPKHKFSNIGPHNVKLEAITSEGCVAQVTKSITLAGVVSNAAIVNTPDSVCEGGSMVFTDPTVTTGVSAWYWDFGNGDIRTITANTAQTVTYTTPGPFTVKHLAILGSGGGSCAGDTVTKIIQVFAKPKPGFTYPVGCLPTNGVVQFIDTSKTTANQVINQWQWNFGDPNASAPNPNTSNLQSPTHIYQSGNYTVTLSVTTNKGCTAQTQVPITLNISPDIAASPNVTICEGSSTTLTVNGATTYNWSPATGLSSTTGASVVASPTVTTTYTVVGTSATCTDTARIVVTVNPRPAPPVAVDTVAYCQTASTTQLTATALAGHTLTWYDNPLLTNGTSTAPTPNSSIPGIVRYYVTQTQTSTGCISRPDSIIVQITGSINGNTIGSDQSLCTGAAPAPLTGSFFVIGGNGTYLYQWQSSIDGGVTWTDIVGATTANYAPGTITVSTRYRRVVQSLPCTSISNVVTINIPNAITNFNVSGTQTVCAGATPAPIDGQTPAGGNGTFTYQWQSSTDSTNWSNVAGATNEDYQAPVAATTIYYRRITTSNNCSVNSNGVKVTVNQLPDGSLSAPASICQYESAAISFTASSGVGPFRVRATITAPGGATTFINQLVNGNGPTVVGNIPANSTPGTYTITFTSLADIIGCTRTTGLNTITVVVNPQPAVTTTPNRTICVGSTVSITANGATTYSWSPAIGLSATTGATVVANPTTTTTYQVIGTSNGCSDTASVTITVNPLPLAPVVSNATLSYCKNAPATPLAATALPGHTLTWYDNAALLNGTTTAPVPVTGTEGVFTYYVTQTNTLTGCLGAPATIAVTVRPLPSVDFDLPTGVCMPGGVVNFINRSTALDNAALNYSWNFGDGSPASTVKDPSHVYANVQNYTVVLTATSSFGCVGTQNKVLQSTVFKPKPIADFQPNATAFCQGVNSSFQDRSTAPNSSVTAWNWSFGDGSVQTVQNPVKRYLRPGNYTVKLTVSNAIGCTSDPDSMQITVYLQPRIDAGPSFTVPIGTTVVFQPVANDSVNLQFNWSPSADFANPSSLQQSLVARRTQVYTLSAIGDGGCTATDQMTVKILNEVKIPNAFSPNGDGVYDTWRIENLADYPGAVVEVFNRYGQRVYYSDGYAREWDGRINGKSLPLGTYYYIIQLKNGFGDLKGSVTIIK